MLLNLKNFITFYEIPDTADNHGCRFWNIFTGLVILRMCRQLHALYSCLFVCLLIICAFFPPLEAVTAQVMLLLSDIRPPMYIRIYMRIHRMNGLTNNNVIDFYRRPTAVETTQLASDGVVRRGRSGSNMRAWVAVGHQHGGRRRTVCRRTVRQRRVVSRARAWQRNTAGASVPAAVVGARRQRVPRRLVRQLLAVGPRRLRRPRANVARHQGVVDVRPAGRLSARVRRSDGDHLADGTRSGQPLSGRLLASKGRRLLLAGGHPAR